MSASTKRKNRQAEIEAGTYRKQTAQRERDEKKAKEKRTLTICIAVVAVIVIAAILLNVIPDAREARELRTYKEGTAVTVGDRSYSPAEVGYLYANQFSTFANNYYAMIYGIDTSNGAKGLGSVAYNGPQLEGKNFVSWRDYFLDAVYSQLKQTQTLLRYAKEKGLTLSEDETAALEQNLSTYETYAAMYNFPNVDQFLEANVGKGVTLDMIRNLDRESALASKAYDDYLNSLSFTAEELAEEYASFDGRYDTYSYALYKVTPQAEEGEEPSDMAKAEAEAEVDAIIASYQDGYDVDDLYDRFNGYIEEMLGGSATRSENVSGSALSSLYADWLKDAARQPGDVTKIADGTNYMAVLFLGHEDANYPTVNVRHILIQAEAGEDGTWSDEALAEAKAEAERILAEWEAGEKTEESFAALAEQYSSDSGSNTNGGLYENLAKGQTVEEFDAFCYADHQPGDTGIVYGSNGSYAGYHVMYYVGQGEIYGEKLAKDSLSQKSLQNWLDSSDVTAVPGAEEALVDPVTAPPAVQDTEAPAEQDAEAPAEQDAEAPAEQENETPIVQD